MIIEFIGLPASGKTTIAKKLFKCEKIGNRKIVYPLFELYEKPWVKRNFLKLFSVIKYAFGNLNKTFWLITSIYYTKQRSFKDYLKVTFNFIFLIYVYKSAVDNDKIFIFDEGIFHHIWAVNYSAEKSNYDIMNFLESNVIPNIVIKVECDENYIRDRLLTRKSNTRIEQNINLSESIVDAKFKLDEVIRAIKVSNLDIILKSIDNNYLNNDAINVKVQNLVDDLGLN